MATITLHPQSKFQAMYTRRFTLPTLKGSVNGKSTEPALFAAFGHQWKLVVWPTGRDSVSAGSIGATLTLMNALSVVTITLSSQWRFWTGKNGDKPVARVQTFGANQYSGAGQCWNFDRLLTCDVVQEDYLLIDLTLIEGADNTSQWTDLLTAAEAKDKAPAPLIRDLADDLRRMLDDPSCADVTFQVGGVLQTAHKSWLKHRSPCMKSMFESKMVESTTNDPIPIKDMHPHVFRALLVYLYSGKLVTSSSDSDVAGRTPVAGGPRLEVKALQPEALQPVASVDPLDGDHSVAPIANDAFVEHLLEAASRFLVPGLVTSCIECLVQTLSASNFVNRLILADRLSPELFTRMLAWLTRDRLREILACKTTQNL